MDLISLIIIISVIVKIFKKNKPDEYEQVRQKAKNIKDEVMGELRSNVNTKHSSYGQERSSFEQKNQQRNNTYEMPKKNVRTTPAREQVQKSRMEANNTSILQRAKGNAAEDSEDATLRSLEESHGHSAHVAPAVHHHPEDEIPENMIGKIEDLMVKGYEVDLCFERDFVGEAMDMVSRFSLGGSVINES